MSELTMIGLRNLGVVIAMLMPSLAQAATAPDAAVRSACTPDARKLCGAVISNPEARHKCMVAHRAQLSDACKAALAQSHQAPAAAAPDIVASPDNPAPPTPATPPASAGPPADSPNPK